MTSDDASKESEFLSALNASPENFVHKALKDEQIECIQRIVCHGRDVFAVLPAGLGKSAIYQLITSKVLFRMGRTANATSKTTAELLVFLLAYKVERYLHQVLLLILTHYQRNRRTCFTK